MKFLISFLLFAFICTVRGGDEGAAKSIQIPFASWSQGFVHMSDAVIVGKITEVTKRVSHLDPSSTVFIYSMEVSAFGGDCPELKGVTEVKSENYHPVKLGQWAIMFIHYYEDKPDLATGNRPLFIIKGVDDPLAKLFIAKGTDYRIYTDKDMLILKNKMPVAYHYIFPRREWLIEHYKISEPQR